MILLYGVFPDFWGVEVGAGGGGGEGVGWASIRQGTFIRGERRIQ